MRSAEVAQRKALFEKIKGGVMIEQTSQQIYAAATNVDGCDNQPLTETREWISKGIEAANHAPITERFNMGVFKFKLEMVC